MSRPASSRFLGTTPWQANDGNTSPPQCGGMPSTFNRRRHADGRIAASHRAAASFSPPRAARTACCKQSAVAILGHRAASRRDAAPPHSPPFSPFKKGALPAGTFGRAASSAVSALGKRRSLSLAALLPFNPQPARHSPNLSGRRRVRNPQSKMPPPLTQSPSPPATQTLVLKHCFFVKCEIRRPASGTQAL